MRRVTFRPTMGQPTRLRWRREALLALVVVVLSFALLTVTAIVFFGDHGRSTNDMPVCTDAIADAGGVCKGEPLPPCPVEDADNCYWDATTMGNGLGRSFITVNGVTTYVED